jgi:lactate dehydrogenase-like 2-hydroxyacid dehydrogenase
MKLTFPDAASLGPGLDIERFSRWGEVVLWDNTRPDQRVSRLSDTVVAIANRTVFDSTLLEACPQLKLVLLTATGYNNVDLEAARRAGVGVCNVVGYSTESVAQHTLALLLTLMEQTAWLDQHAKGPWAGSTSFEHLGRPFHEIRGRTWGIVGLGNIGGRVAELAQAFGARVQYYSTTGSDRSPTLPRVGLGELLATSDILTIHSPATEATRGLIGTPQLEQMKPGAYLVNVGRGGIVDEAALARALDAGRIAGAALDVTLPEPPLPDNPLLHLAQPDRLVLSPHVAWASVESRMRCLDEVEENLRSWVAGGRRNRLD